MNLTAFRRPVLAAALLLSCLGAQAQEATIRKQLSERVPQLKPTDEGIQEAMHSGVLAGFPCVDIKVTIYDGSFHEVGALSGIGTYNADGSITDFPGQKYLHRD